MIVNELSKPVAVPAKSDPAIAQIEIEMALASLCRIWVGRIQKAIKQQKKRVFCEEPIRRLTELEKRVIENAADVKSFRTFCAAEINRDSIKPTVEENVSVEAAMAVERLLDRLYFLSLKKKCVPQKCYYASAGYRQTSRKYLTGVDVNFKR